MPVKFGEMGQLGLLVALERKVVNSDAELTRAQVKDLTNWLMVPGEDEEEEELDLAQKEYIEENSYKEYVEKGKAQNSEQKTLNDLIDSL
ncbi:MAG: hypothetical protein EZS28_018392 [Streblomastix strix]|uniref:Uncharacterized protein n=1 Tax=Streblomastix strix TaxID=222440 RepID=A0A5J4VTX2_9EUKA|nr:MAG: hypothetical protein EZS28_018392 [Streblomastix strix]